jgi:hypothetical protein
MRYRDGACDTREEEDDIEEMKKAIVVKEYLTVQKEGGKENGYDSVN